MSTKTPARLEDSGNDDGIDAVADDREPTTDALAAEIAATAPYANNRFHVEDGR